MGWCSGTDLFDAVAKYILDDKEKKDPEDILRILVIRLEGMDWDCQMDSKYYNHPIVQKVMRELHPSWFEE